MNSSEKTVFTSLMAGVAELYSKALSPKLLEIYWEILQIYSLRQVKQALHSHLLDTEKGPFMPKPADLIRYLEGGNGENALCAWTKVFFAIKSFGAYESVTFEDPIIHTVIIEMGGWIKICEIHEDKLPFLGIEFRKRYQVYRRRPSLHPPLKLSGIFDHQNQLQGYPSLKPVLIQTKAPALSLSVGNEKETDSHE